MCDVTKSLQYDIEKGKKKTLRKKANAILLAIWLNEHAHRAYCVSNCRWFADYDCLLNLFVSLLHLISNTSYAYRIPKCAFFLICFAYSFSLLIRLRFAKQKQFVNKFLTKWRWIVIGKGFKNWTILFLCIWTNSLLIK